MLNSREQKPIVMPFQYRISVILAVVLQSVLASSFLYADQPNILFILADDLNHKLLKQFQLPELAPDALGQLYDLSEDPSETTNLSLSNPSKAEQLRKLLAKSIEEGRSR